MEHDQSPFRAQWWSTDLGTARPCDSTYCAFPYETLPPLDKSLFRDEFQWLPPLKDETNKTMAAHRRKREETLKSRLDALTVQAWQFGLTLPPAFLKFMGSSQLQDRVPSCTACYFDLPKNITKSTVGDGYFIRFLNDQQDVFFWFLYVDGSGEHCVVNSEMKFDAEEELNAWAGDHRIDELTLRFTTFSAPSFESFLHRYWLENLIWFALNEGDGSLTDTQRAYVDHYRSQP
jgi:hypothetical protein